MKIMSLNSGTRVVAKRIQITLLLRRDTELKISCYEYEFNAILPTYEPPSIRGQIRHDLEPIRSDEKLDLIIGQDWLWSLLDHKQSIRETATGLRIVPTRFGPVYCGKEEQRGNTSLFEQAAQKAQLQFCFVSSTEKLAEALEMQWRAEKLHNDHKTEMRSSELMALEKMNEMFRYIPELQRYETGLLFSGPPDFKNNYKHAKERFDNLEKRSKRMQA